MRIVVTGGSGKAGRAVVRELLEHGHSVRNVDLVPDPDPVCGFRRADLTDLGQAFEVLSGFDAVVHLAAIARPGLFTEAATFQTNVMSTFNVFDAACLLELTRVVWASSETTLGLPFDDSLPYLPIDEAAAPAPKSAYALSKVVGEEMARYFNARSGIPFVGLRFSNVFTADDYAQVESFQEDPRLRSWNAWGYVDARDVGLACRLGVEAPFEGADVFIIAAADTVMEQTNKELATEVFPTVTTHELGEHDSLLSIQKARDVLGYEPQHSWRAPTGQERSIT
jgi:nucleoside-diphosphate-sugar epimerase